MAVSAASATGSAHGPARRLRRDAETNRRRILDAAARLMAEHGLTVPMEDIAAAAGVGVGTLYRRFPSREVLVEELFEERVAAYVVDLETSLRFADGWDGLMWFLEQALTRQIADRALGELLRGEQGGDWVEVILDRLAPLYERLVAEAKASGRLRGDFDATDLALLQAMLCALGSATGPVDPGVWRRYLTVVVDGMAFRRDRPTTQTHRPLTPAQVGRVVGGVEIVGP